ncbi:Arginase [hydrothermal vent metagenome]|uniref:Arginase n=1 Tax=hydrothermal vent metagenome TaxID=652676 RepID=A0A3B0U6E6_9ZZZZ
MKPKQMPHKKCTIIGAPVETGAGRRGSQMGPDALRTAGLAQALGELGFEVSDIGNLVPDPLATISHPFAAKNLGQTIAWTIALERAAFEVAQSGSFPIFAGGDHSVSLGSVSGIARHAQQLDRPLFVLWLDAHADFHRLDTTPSGNLHGTPVAYFTGRESFTPYFAAPISPVPTNRVMMMGIRSLDRAERQSIRAIGVKVHDMRDIDEFGIIKPLNNFIDEVKSQNGLLHVSLDVDFLDPEIAPAVGTCVPGGATFREAHLIMEILSQSDIVSSLDLAELNPFLDHRGKTARLMVDLTTSLMGKQIMDRPATSY